MIGDMIAGLPIGVTDDAYVEIEIELEPGEILTLYSDGFPDAESTQPSRFGRARLESAIVAAPGNCTEAVLFIVNEVEFAVSPTRLLVGLTTPKVLAVPRPNVAAPAYFTVSVYQNSLRTT